MQTSEEKKDLPFRILFVDDEPHARKYFQKTFSDRFEIKTTASVSEAKDFLGKNQSEIGVVVTDYSMPAEKGIELLVHVKEHYPDIVRIMTTAFCDVDNTLEAINKGEVFRYISKPWDASIVSDTLEKAMRLHLKQRLSMSLSDNGQAVVNDFKKACERWLLYAFHACDNIDGFNSGLDAISCIYFGHIEQHFSEPTIGDLRDEMETYMENLIDKTVVGTKKEEVKQGFFDETKH